MAWQKRITSQRPNGSNWKRPGLYFCLILGIVIRKTLQLKNRYQCILLVQMPFIGAVHLYMPELLLGFCGFYPTYRVVRKLSIG